MRFQVQSDVHLEVGYQYETYKITPTAPYLILAGDIGNLKQYDGYLSFLRVQCAQFRKVFWVLGNHEFYNITRQTGVGIAQKLAHEPGCEGILVLLHRARFDLAIHHDSVPADEIDNINGKDERRQDTGPEVVESNHVYDSEDHQSEHIVILGCTLNSKITGNDDQKLLVQMKVLDFHKIQDWKIDDHNAEHEQDITWLRQEVENLVSTRSERKRTSKSSLNGKIGKGGGQLPPVKPKILVITHHAPFRKGCGKPQNEDSDWQDAFATELLDTDPQANVKTTTAANDGDDDGDDDGDEFRTSQTASRPPDKSISEQGNILQNVNTWIFGHTHYTTECIRGGVRCVANQRGYVFPWQMKNDSIQDGKGAIREGQVENDQILNSDNKSSPPSTSPKENENKINMKKADNTSESLLPLSSTSSEQQQSSTMPSKPSKSKQEYDHRHLPVHKRILNSLFSHHSKPGTTTTTTTSSFIVRPPKESKGHQGDGSKPFDPLAYIEI